jgi:hypothetical protein
LETCLASFAVEVGLPQADALAGDAGHLLPGALLVRPVLHLRASGGTGANRSAPLEQQRRSWRAGSLPSLVARCTQSTVLEYRHPSTPNRIESKQAAAQRGAREREGGAAADLDAVGLAEALDDLHGQPLARLGHLPARSAAWLRLAGGERDETAARLSSSRRPTQQVVGERS